MQSAERQRDDWDVFEEIGQEPAAETHLECDCWRLIRELGPDEELPDHVCVETARVTTRKWAQCQVGKLVGHMGLAEIYASSESADGETANISLDRVVDRECDVWPLRYDGRHIGFVINQWTEGCPSKKLAKQLAEDRRWQSEVHVMRQLYEFLAATRSDDPLTGVAAFVARASDADGCEGTPKTKRPDPAFIAEWLQKAGWNASGAGLNDEDQRGVDELADRLRRSGLPYNPSVLRHLRAVAAEMEELLPAPGLLVTTTVFIGIDDDGTVWCRQNPQINVEGSQTSGPATLFRAVQPVAKRHREFVERFATHPFTDLSQIRRAQVKPNVERPMKDLTTDYLEEARANVAELREIAKRYGDDRVGAVTEYLDRVQRRVDGRRRRRRIPDRAPANWRTKIFPELVRLLRPDN